MTPKEKVQAKYPKAYASEDVDGFWHIWCPTVRGALSGGPWSDSRSAAKAWKLAADTLTPNVEFSGAQRSGASAATKG